MKLSIVVSVFNEEEALPHFYESFREMSDQLNLDYQLLFINDGSKDQSQKILEEIAQRDSKIEVLQFSRNFGHEAAMLAGLDHAAGDFIVCMDADLQHPTESLVEIIEAAKEGFEVISMVRSERADGGFLKSSVSKLFYHLLNRISEVKLAPNASDFFGISARVKDILVTDYRERTRFLRGLTQLVGFKKTSIEFKAPKRVAGESSYGFFNLLFFSFSAISSLSKAPLKLGIYTGSVIGILSFLLLIYSLIMWWIDTPVGGYTTLIVVITGLFSILFFLLGIIGNYIGLLFDEAKSRPSYLVMKHIKNV